MYTWIIVHTLAKFHCHWAFILKEALKEKRKLTQVFERKDLNFSPDGGGWLAVVWQTFSWDG